MSQLCWNHQACLKAAVPRHCQALPCREERELRPTAREHLQDIHSPLKRAAVAVNCGFRKTRVVCVGCETLPAAAGSARLPTRRHLVPPSGAGDYYRVFIRLGLCFVKMPCFSWQWQKQRETRPIISIKKWSKFADAKCPSQGWKQERSRGSEKYVALPPLDANGLLVFEVFQTVFTLVLPIVLQNNLCILTCKLQVFGQPQILCSVKKVVMLSVITASL